MDKYYTPQIEEFHIGFEFEYMGDRGEDNSRWHKDIIDDKFWTFKSLWDRLNNYTIPMLRVKYLDSEDIESLGFRKVESRDFYGTEILVYLFDFVGTDDSFGNMKTCELNIDTQTNIIRIEDYDWHLFMGKIKNKLELKKLLKQLCITK